MLVEIIKKRQSPEHADDHVLNKRDQFYGLDLQQINPLKDQPPQALTFGCLNQDVMIAMNEGDKDVNENGANFPNCYTPAETLRKAQREALPGLSDGNIQRRFTE